MSSEGGSSKSATIEMYAPSSYNETVNGETLSSISEKSESYRQNGSHSDYAVRAPHDWIQLSFTGFSLKLHSLIISPYHGCSPVPVRFTFSFFSGWYD